MPDGVVLTDGGSRLDSSSSIANIILNILIVPYLVILNLIHYRSEVIYQYCQLFYYLRTVFNHSKFNPLQIEKNISVLKDTVLLGAVFYYSKYNPLYCYLLGTKLYFNMTNINLQSKFMPVQISSTRDENIYLYHRYFCIFLSLEKQDNHSTQ